MSEEREPYDLAPDTPGAKFDAHKLRYGLILRHMPQALRAVVDVAEYGAAKYSEQGWAQVAHGIERYTEAMLRHQQAEFAGEARDAESNLLHAAQTAWNALARLELMLREQRGLSAPSREATADKPSAADHPALLDTLEHSNSAAR